MSTVSSTPVSLETRILTFLQENSDKPVTAEQIRRGVLRAGYKSIQPARNLLAFVRKRLRQMRDQNLVVINEDNTYTLGAKVQVPSVPTKPQPAASQTENLEGILHSMQVLMPIFGQSEEWQLMSKVISFCIENGGLERVAACVNLLQQGQVNASGLYNLK